VPTKQNGDTTKKIKEEREVNASFIENHVYMKTNMKRRDRWIPKRKDMWLDKILF